MSEDVRSADAALTASLLEHAIIVVGRELPQSCQHLLPVDAYMAAAGDCDPYDHPDPRPARQLRLFAAVQDRHGRDVAVAMRRLALLRLALQRARSPQLERLPRSLRLLTQGWLARLGNDALEQPLGWFDPDGGDRLQAYGVVQDFAVAAGRALPVGGAWIVERRRLHDTQVFPVRATHLRGPVRAAVRRVRSNLLAVASRLGLRVGLRTLRRRVEEARGHYADYYVIHTANRYRRQFSARQMDVGYANIAELLRADVGAVGIYRQSWFLDPEVGRLDPRLAFLVEVPRRHGADLRRLGPVAGSLPPEIAAFSAARRAQLRDGSYVPVEWAYLWRREDVLRWASSARAEPRIEASLRIASAGTVERG